MIRDAHVETIRGQAVFMEVIRFGDSEQLARDNYDDAQPSWLFSDARVPQCVHAFVYERDNTKLGAVTLATNGISVNGKTFPGPLIDAVYVTPDHRGEGICTELLIKALERFRQLGATGDKSVHIHCESGDMKSQLESFKGKHFSLWSMLCIDYNLPP